MRPYWVSLCSMQHGIHNCKFLGDLELFGPVTSIMTVFKRTGWDFFSLFFFEKKPPEDGLYRTDSNTLLRDLVSAQRFMRHNTTHHWECIGLPSKIERIERQSSY
jgi:hypothetical protein